MIKTNPTKSCIYPMRDWVTCVEACVSKSKVVIMLTKLLLRVDSTKGAQSIRGNPTQIRQSLMNTGQVRELEIVANIIGSAIVGARTAFIIFLKLKVNKKKKDHLQLQKRTGMNRKR